jgi:hypothetical protein
LEHREQFERIARMLATKGANLNPKITFYEEEEPKLSLLTELKKAKHPGYAFLTQLIAERKKSKTRPDTSPEEPNATHRTTLQSSVCNIL